MLNFQTMFFYELCCFIWRTKQIFRKRYFSDMFNFFFVTFWHVYTYKKCFIPYFKAVLSLEKVVPKLLNSVLNMFKKIIKKRSSYMRRSMSIVFEVLTVTRIREMLWASRKWELSVGKLVPQLLNTVFYWFST